MKLTAASYRTRWRKLRSPGGGQTSEWEEEMVVEIMRRQKDTGNFVEMVNAVGRTGIPKPAGFPAAMDQQPAP